MLQNRVLTRFIQFQTGKTNESTCSVEQNEFKKVQQSMKKTIEPDAN